MNKEREIDTETILQDVDVQKPTVSVFVCANCARPGKAATSAKRSRPSIPDFGWPVPVQQITIPCAGRVQPEHIFEGLRVGSRSCNGHCLRRRKLSLYRGKQEMFPPCGIHPVHPGRNRTGRRTPASVFPPWLCRRGHAGNGRENGRDDRFRIPEAENRRDSGANA